MKTCTICGLVFQGKHTPHYSHIEGEVVKKLLCKDCFAIHGKEEGAVKEEKRPRGRPKKYPTPVAQYAEGEAYGTTS